MKWADVKAMVVPKLGVADGLLSQMFEEALGYPPDMNPSRAMPEQA